jgi:hypothetical protein
MPICAKCGKEFVGHRNWQASRYYCSTECQYSDIVEEPCLWCGKPFKVRRYLLGTKRYCSTSCRNKGYWERKKDRPKALRIEEAAYIAAFIDGEGTISIRKYKRKAMAGGVRYVPVVEMNNSDVGVMQYLRSVIGPNRYHVHSKQRQENHKKMYQLRLPSNVQRWLLEEILPYLRIKRRQAEIVMQLLDLLRQKKYGEDANLEDREKLYQEVHDINHRGLGAKKCNFKS